MKLNADYFVSGPVESGAQTFLSVLSNVWEHGKKTNQS